MNLFFLIQYHYKMTQYSSLNLKCSYPYINKLKSGIKTAAEVILNFSLNVMGDSDYETSFSHKLLLNERPVLRFCKLLQIILGKDSNFL